MNFLEKDLEQIIWETESSKLEDRGLYNISGIKKRQVRIGNYGILDLMTVKRCESPSGLKYLSITVFELKKESIGSETFLQAVRYCKGISRYLDERGFWEFELNISIIGKNIDPNSSVIFLPDLIQGSDFGNLGKIASMNILTYSYDFDGISFKDHTGYKLINEGF